MDKMDLLKKNLGEFADGVLNGIDLESNQLQNAKQNCFKEVSMLSNFIVEKCKDQDVAKKAIEELIDTTKDATIISLMADMLELEEPKEEEHDNRGTKE